MKLSKTKIIILILLTTVFVAGTVFGICLSAVLENDEIKTSEGVAEFVFSPGTQKEITLKLGESKKGYITLNGDFKGYRLVSSRGEVVQFFAEKMTGNNRIYYNILALSVGEATLYVETQDGKIKSEEIKVKVISDSEN